MPPTAELPTHAVETEALTKIYRASGATPPKKALDIRLIRATGET